MRISMLALLVVSVTCSLRAADVEVSWEAASVGVTVDANGFEIPSTNVPGITYCRAHIHNTTTTQQTVSFDPASVVVSSAATGFTPNQVDTQTFTVTLDPVGTVVGKLATDTVDVQVEVTVASGASNGQLSFTFVYGASSISATPSIGLHVYAAAPLPPTLSITAPPQPESVNLPVPTAELPSLAIKNAPTGSYSIAWTFTCPTIIGGTSYAAGQAYMQTVTVTSLPIPFPTTLIFKSPGITTITATIASLNLASTADAVIYSAVSFSAKGSGLDFTKLVFVANSAQGNVGGHLKIDFTTGALAGGRLDGTPGKLTIFSAQTADCTGTGTFTRNGTSTAVSFDVNGLDGGDGGAGDVLVVTIPELGATIKDSPIVGDVTVSIMPTGKN